MWIYIMHFAFKEIKEKHRQLVLNVSMNMQPG